MTTPSSQTERIRARILIVEDPSIFREMQSLLLRRAGYAVVTCDQPQLALLEAANQPFDVAVLNSEAPGLDHPEFLNSLRRHCPPIAVIFVASALTVEVARDLSSHGVATVLQGPIDPTQLLQKIDEAMGAALKPAPSIWYSAPEAPNYDSQSRSPFRAPNEVRTGSQPPSAAASDSTTAPGSFRPLAGSPFITGYSGHTASPFISTSASPFSSFTR